MEGHKEEKVDNTSSGSNFSSILSGPFFNKCCWKSRISTCRKMKLYLTFTKIDSRHIKDLNVRSETQKPLEKKVGKQFKVEK